MCVFISGGRNLDHLRSKVDEVRYGLLKEGCKLLMRRVTKRNALSAAAGKRGGEGRWSKRDPASHRRPRVPSIAGLMPLRAACGLLKSAPTPEPVCNPCHFF